MTFRQKIGRIFCIFLTLVIACILAALALAAMIFVAERELAMGSELLTGTAIVVAGLFVNAICVIVLLRFRA